MGARGRITPGVLPFALRATLRVFKFVPDEFVEPAEVLVLPRAQKSPLIAQRAWLCGARGRIRTSDRLVRSQVLYPAELHALYKRISFYST